MCPADCEAKSWGLFDVIIPFSPRSLDWKREIKNPRFSPGYDGPWGYLNITEDSCIQLECEGKHHITLAESVHRILSNIMTTITNIIAINECQTYLFSQEIFRR